MDRICGVKVDASDIGKRFGALVVVGAWFARGYYTEKHGIRKPWYAVCRCDCGEVRIISKHGLERQGTTSCGCLGRTKHGKRRSSEYDVWCAMKQRCQNENNSAWANYGGRGISVCNRWSESFQNFIDDMGERPSRDHTIERVDNDGSYCPENCIWATRREQSLNNRHNRLIEIDGETKTLKEWLEIYRVSHTGFYLRLRRGMSVEEAIKTPGRLARQFHAT